MGTMTASLCSTFATLAYETHERLGACRQVGHQLLEETITDLLILELKRLHPREIFCQTFTKPQESMTGADWEWWLTDPSRSRWLGLRVQAKVLELKSDSFAHLHYKSKRGRAYQTTRLKRAAEADGLAPFYCLYTHAPAAAKGWLRFGSAAGYGCSLLPVKHVEKLRRRGKRTDFSSVMAEAVPWSMLVCVSAVATTSGKPVTFPDFAAGMVDGELPWLWDDEDGGTEAVQLPLKPGIRKSPPLYVTAMMEGQPVEELDKPLRGILVIQGPAIENKPFEDLMQPIVRPDGSSPQ
jgi:hypothetical protein